MKRAYPRYYPQFSCIAGECRHSCCIGWEIDIDPKSYEKYRKLPGEMGERLRRNIFEDEEGAHFLLTKQERCPFLNEKGLCDLILDQGEDILCQICADHPRFRNFFSDREEIGLGLCCEAAGKLILSDEAPFELVEEGEESLSEEESMLLALRKELFALLQDRALPMETRIHRLLQRCHVPENEKTLSEWAEIFLALERLDEAWTEKLHGLSRPAESEKWPEHLEIPLEQLACYFLYRHLAGAAEDGDIQGRAAFIALSVGIVAAIFCREASPSLDRLIEIARLYSSEIEYSSENMQSLMDAWFEEGM